MCRCECVGVCGCESVCLCESVCGCVNVSERGSVSDFERESERIESELVSAWVQ